MASLPVANPFGAPPAPVAAGSAAALANQQREIAEVQAAITIAKRFPRDERAVMDQVLMACTRPGLAEAAVYQYARGGQDVSGPSIRLAEAIAQKWGNFQFGFRELEQSNGASTVEAWAWDLESNVRKPLVFVVPHERHTKNGTKRLTDPRDIYELVANQAARRMRNAILALIPGDVTDAAVKQCEATLHTKAEVTPERLLKLVESFQQFGVTKEHIEKRIQRKLDAITPAQLVQLGKVFNSLRDGMSQPGEWFDVAPPPPATSEAVSALNDGIARPAARRPAAVKAPPAPPPAAEILTYDEAARAINEATTLEALQVLENRIPSVQDDPDNELPELLNMRRELIAAQQPST